MGLSYLQYLIPVFPKQAPEGLPILHLGNLCPEQELSAVALPPETRSPAACLGQVGRTQT